MKALVTGSAGFVGRHFLDELHKRCYEVRRIDIADPYGLTEDLLTELPTLTTKFDLVIHAAARTPHRVAIDTQPASHIYNQLLDAAMFEWAVRTGQGRVLYLSSCAAADETPDAYGLLKLTGERMAEQARAAGVPVTVVRPYSGYGEDQSEDFPFGAFVARARRREDPFPLWNASAVRDWVHVKDLVGGALAAVEAGVETPVSLCTGVGTSCGEVAELVARMFGYSPDFKVLEDMPAGVDQRVGDPREMLAFYRPLVSLEEGVRRAALR